MKIKILEFTEYPGPRYKNQGDFSGEEYYITRLNALFCECYSKKEKLVILLDGTAGFPSSFLDEAFGELVYDFSLDIVKEWLVIETQRYSRHKQMIENETYNQWEEKRNNNNHLKRTMSGYKIWFYDGHAVQAKEI